MSDTLIQQLSAKVRNLFSLADFLKRYDDGKVQVKTLSGKVMEQKEHFPYGFTAKAKTGKTLVFCPGGNFNSFLITPIAADDDVHPPKLEEGDVALYTGEGGWIVLREAGGIEVNAKSSGNITTLCEDGKIYFGNNITNLCVLMIGFIDEIKAIVTSGTPPSHTIDPATQQKLEAYKNKFKDLLKESV